MTGSPTRRPISDVTWTPPPQWVGWVPGAAQADAEALAAQVTDDPAVIPGVAAGLRALDTAWSDPAGAPVTMGAWLPHPAAGVVGGSLVIRLISPDPDGRLSPEALLALAQDPPRRKGLRVLESSAAPGQLAAGPAVLLVTDLTARFSRRIVREYTWFVLPPGTDETLMCQFETDQAWAFEPLGDQTNLVTDSLVVTLEDA